MTSLAFVGEGINHFANADLDYRTSDSNGIFQFRGYTIDTTKGTLILPGSGGATKGIFGVLLSAPNAGEAALVRVIGVAKILLAGTVTMFDPLEIDQYGRFIERTSTHSIVGYALATGVTGDLISAWIMGALT